MSLIYYEDIVVGNIITAGQYEVDKNEMIEFAQKWDRQPYHLSEESARSYPYGGLIAPATYILSIAARVLSPPDEPRLAVIGLLEYEHVRTLNPCRPGDCLTVTYEAIEKRKSKNKPNRGIIRHEVLIKNQHDEVVASYIAAFLVERRDKDG